MKQKANTIYSFIQSTPKDHISWPKSRISPKTVSIKKPFNEVLLLSLKVTGISEDQLLVTVLPGLPTTAEIFIVPERTSRDGAMDEKWAHLDQVVPCQIILMACGRCSVQCGFLR